ncbi:MAG: Gfo/Idh/MocA family protein [Porticoccaceae bacterium]
MINGEKIVERPVRWAMVGGGRTGQIGYLHRSSALRDNNFQLIAGAFDIDPNACRDFGVQLGLDEKRCYASYKEMFSSESKLNDGIEAVSIATPNSTHYEICKAAICAGLHVICEKPLCFTVQEAKELESLAKDHGRVVGTMYGYAGYQTIEQARQMIAEGDLGNIRIVNMQFAHGFHCEAVEEHCESLKWRVDPRVSGPSYVLGDLGTHPVYLAGVMLPHMKIKRLLCSRQSFVKTRAPLEDNAYTLMEYDNGAVGTLWCSGVNAGSMHSQKIRIIGSKASLEWWDEHPNQLRYEVQGRPVQVLERGMSYLYPEALKEDRVSGGHPEGLFEAWSNLYARFALAIDASNKGDTYNGWYPGMEAGVDGVRWVENCVRSADQGAVWVDYL